MEYLYNEIGYYHIGAHRQVLDFDPFAITGSPELLNILYSCSDSGETYNTLFFLMETEYSAMGLDIPSLPPSFLMILKSIQLSWIQLIIDGVFKKSLFYEFINEYKYVISTIIDSDINNKEGVVFRTVPSGDNIFDIAGRVHITSEYSKALSNNSDIREAIDTAYNQVIISYTKLSNILEIDDGILKIKNYSGKSITDNINSLVDMLLEGGGYNA